MRSIFRTTLCCFSCVGFDEKVRAVVTSSITEEELIRLLN